MANYIGKKFLIYLAAGVIPYHSCWGDIALSGNPPPFTINSAVAGQQPNSITNNTTSYSVLSLITANIAGALTHPLPSGVSLTVTLAAPLLATSSGPVIMTTTNQTLVSGILVLLTVTGLTITYKLNATVEAAPVANATASVVYTIQ